MHMAKKPEPSLNLDELVPAREAAQLLHVTPHTLAKWRMDGVGPDFIRMGKLKSRCMYERSAISAYLIARRVRQVAA